MFKSASYLVACATTALLAASPAFAIRTVFTSGGFFASYDYPVSGISGFTFYTDDPLPQSTNVDVATAVCLDDNSLCDSVRVYRDNPQTSVYFGPANDFRGLFASRYSPSSKIGVDGVQQLAAGEVVYSYADTTGTYFTFLSQGYLNKGASFSELLCYTIVNQCRKASFDGSRFALSHPDVASAANSLAIPTAFLSNEGTYTLREGSVRAQFAVITSGLPDLPPPNPDPLPGGSGAVPEPATWATMMLGFGLVGLAARRRRRSVAA